jgi:hypothetical protein
LKHEMLPRSVWREGHGRHGCPVAAGRLRVILEGELEDHWDATGGVGGCNQRGANVDCDERVGGVVDMANEVLDDGGNLAVERVRVPFSTHDLPADGWRVSRDAAEDLAVEELEQLRAPLLLPHFGGGDSLAVVEHERVREIREWIGRGLVEARAVGTVRSRRGARAKRSDVQQIHHTLMIFSSGELNCRRRGRPRLCAQRDEDRGVEEKSELERMLHE